MKKFLSFTLIFATLNLMFVACEKDPEEVDPGSAPELPPYESMAIDFGSFNDINSDKENPLFSNYQYAALNVGFFNIILTVTLVVPVAAFYHSFSAEAEYIENTTWQWSNSYEVLSATYHSRLTGKVNPDHVKWEMYVSREGVGAFEEFKWYEGTSQLNGMGGQWILNHSQQHQDPMLQIDWVRNGDDVGEVKYTNVRELGDDGSANEGYGSYIEAGKTSDYYDAYYNIHLSEESQDILIEWSTSEYFGRVMNDSYFDTAGWHCWDSLGNDLICN